MGGVGGGCEPRHAAGWRAAANESEWVGFNWQVHMAGRVFKVEAGVGTCTVSTVWESAIEIEETLKKIVRRNKVCLLESEARGIPLRPVCAAIVVDDMVVIDTSLVWRH